LKVCDRIASGLSPRYYLSTDAIIWDYSGGDTFCRMCGGCATVPLKVDIVEYMVINKNPTVTACKILK